MFVKHLLFQSKTEYHAGNQAQADRKYGLKVVRYDVSEIDLGKIDLNIRLNLACKRFC